MLGKSWFVSELTGINNSHSICGFLSYKECVCRGLEAAAKAGEEARDCLMLCLACREPRSTHKTSRSVPASANFFLLYVALLLDWVSPGHKFCTRANFVRFVQILYDFVFVCAHSQTTDGQSTETLCHQKKIQNSRKELGVRGLKQQPTYLLHQRGWTESQS